MILTVRLLLVWKIEEHKLNDRRTRKNNSYDQDSTGQRKTVRKERK